MVDTKSIGGTIATILLSIASDVTKSDITFLMFIALSSSTIVYNIIKTTNEFKNKK